MDNTSLGRLSEIVEDYQLETETVSSKTVVHIIHGVHGRRRQIWRWGEELGRGGTGVVQLQSCVEGRAETEPKLRAVKCLPLKDSSKFLYYSRELGTLAKFSQPKYSEFFVRCDGWFKTSSWLYISLEYLHLGDLGNYLDTNHTIPDQQARSVGCQIANALGYMHRAGYAHRDLKPQNILVAACPPLTWWIKLGDFGLSKRVAADFENTDRMGTEGYTAPEISFGSHNRGSTGDGYTSDWLAADMWSFGQVIGRILLGTPALQGRLNQLEYLQGNLSFPFDQLREAGVSGEAVDFISTALCIDVQRRITVEAALAHPWLRPETHRLSLRKPEFRLSGDRSSLCTDSVRPWNTSELDAPSAGTFRQRTNSTLDISSAIAPAVAEANSTVPNEFDMAGEDDLTPTQFLSVSTLAAPGKQISRTSLPEMRNKAVVRMSPRPPEFSILEQEFDPDDDIKGSQANYVKALSLVEELNTGCRTALDDALVLVRLPKSRGLITGLALSSDSTQLAIAYAAAVDNSETEKAASFSPKRMFKGFEQKVKLQAKSKANKHSTLTSLRNFVSHPPAASPTEAPRLQLWEMHPPVCIDEVRNFAGSLQRVVFSPDSTWIVGIEACNVLFFDVANGLSNRHILRHGEQVTSIEFDGVSKNLLSSTRDLNINIWYIPGQINENPVLRYKLDLDRLNPIVMTSFSHSGDENLLLTLSLDGIIRGWHASDEGIGLVPTDQLLVEGVELVGSNRLQNKKPYLATLSPNGGCLAIAHGEGVSLLRKRACIWSYHTPGVGNNILATIKQVYAMEFLKDSPMLLVSYVDGPAELWNVFAGQRAMVFSNCDKELISLSPSWGYATAASAIDNSEVVLRDMGLCTAINEIQSHIGSAQFIASSPDWRWAVSIPFSTSTEETLCFWSLREATIKHVRWTFPHETTIQAEFSEDSRSLVCLSRDLQISIWHVETGTLLKIQLLDKGRLLWEQGKRARSADLGRRFSSEYGPADISTKLYWVAVADVFAGQCAVYVWSVLSGHHIQSLSWLPISPLDLYMAGSSQAPGAIVELAFLPNAGQLALVLGGEVIIFDISTAMAIMKFSLRDAVDTQLIYERVDGKPSFTKPSNFGPLQSSARGLYESLRSSKHLLSIGDDENKLALITRSGSVMIMDLCKQSALSLDVFPGIKASDTGKVIYPALSPDWRMLAIATETGKIAIYEPVQHTLLLMLNAPSGGLCFLAFSGDSQILVAVSSIGYTLLDTVTEHYSAGSFQRSTGVQMRLHISAAHVSSNNCTLVVSTDDGFVYMWDLRHQVLLNEYRGHTGIVDRNLKNNGDSL